MVRMYIEVYHLHLNQQILYETARETIAKFINAKTNQIIFTKSTTHGLNMLSSSFKDILNPGDEIVISNLEHHSNLLPWLNLADELKLVVKFIPLVDGLITIENFKKVLT